MSWVPSLQARLQLGPFLRLQVNPRLVTLYAAPPHSRARTLGKRCRASFLAAGYSSPTAARVQRTFLSLASFKPAASAWSEPIPVDQHPKAALLTDLVEVWPDYSSSRLYTQLMAELEGRGQTNYRAHPILNCQDLNRLFEAKLGPLLMSLQTYGYRCRSEDDVGTALISERGDLIKSDKADHRFFSAVRWA